MVCLFGSSVKNIKVASSPGHCECFYAEKWMRQFEKKTGRPSRAYALTMAIPSILSHLVLILIFSGGLASNLVLQSGAHAARIPEHSCHKLVPLSNCDNQKCSQECSKHPNGVGQCKATACFCTYYCKDPPL